MLKQSVKKYKRIAVKIGSSLLCTERGCLERGIVSGITRQIASLAREGKEVIIISSGAVALGMTALGLSGRPKELARLQAAAAIGQPELMSVWRRSFKDQNLACAQILLTWEDFDDRTRYLNAKNTLLSLLKMKAVPVINENDTVSTDEIKFGDNDRLSALVALLAHADLLIILSDVDGLMDRDRNIVRCVHSITPAITALACPSQKRACVGGMSAKIEAARIAAHSGIPCVIANGTHEGIIRTLALDPSVAGTFFAARDTSLPGRKQWIAFGTKPKGSLIVDDGAKRALLAHKSLLAVGIAGVEGAFCAREIVSLRGKTHDEFARGRSRFSADEIARIKGRRFEREIIHRDDIVIMS